MSATYSTRNVGLAGLMRYLYTPAAHLRTYIDGSKGALFEFRDDEGDCHAIMQRYQRMDGGDGYAIADVETLVDEIFAVRKTVNEAITSGEWRNEG